MVPAAYLVNSVPADVSTSVRDATTTLAPCRAKPRHIARPMPRLPPVTSATLSRNVTALSVVTAAGDSVHFGLAQVFTPIDGEVGLLKPERGSDACRRDSLEGHRY